MGKIYLNEGFDFNGRGEISTGELAASRSADDIAQAQLDNFIEEFAKWYPNADASWEDGRLGGQNGGFKRHLAVTTGRTAREKYSKLGYDIAEYIVVPPRGEEPYTHIETALGVACDLVDRLHLGGRVVVCCNDCTHRDDDSHFCISPDIGESAVGEWCYNISGDEFLKAAPRIPDGGTLVFYRCHFNDLPAVLKTLMAVKDVNGENIVIKTKESYCTGVSGRIGRGMMGRDDGQFGRLFTSLVKLNRDGLSLVLADVSGGLSIDGVKKQVSSLLKKRKKTGEARSGADSVCEGFDFGGSDDLGNQNLQAVKDSGVVDEYFLDKTCEWLRDMWNEGAIDLIKFKDGSIVDNMWNKPKKLDDLGWWRKMASAKLCEDGLVELDLIGLILRFEHLKWQDFLRRRPARTLRMPQCRLVLNFRKKDGGYCMTVLKNIEPFRRDIIENCKYLKINNLCADDLRGAPSVQYQLELDKCNIRAPFKYIEWLEDEPRIIMRQTKGLPGPQNWEGLPDRLDQLRMQFTADGVYYGTDNAIKNASYEFGKLKNFPTGVKAERGIQLVPKYADKWARDAMKSDILYACRQEWADEKLAMRMFRKLTKMYDEGAF